MSILVTKYSVPVQLFLDYSTQKVHLLPNFKSVLHTEGKYQLVSFNKYYSTVHDTCIYIPFVY